VCSQTVSAAWLARARLNNHAMLRVFIGIVCYCSGGANRTPTRPGEYPPLETYGIRFFGGFGTAPKLPRLLTSTWEELKERRKQAGARD